jgi:hypothetical protein
VALVATSFTAPWAGATAGRPRLAPAGVAARLDATTGAPTPLLAPTAGGGGTGSSGASGGRPGGAPPAAGIGTKTVTRTWLEHALSRRVTTLDGLTRSVESSGALTSSVRATLESQLETETSGIQALAASVTTEAATQLRATAVTMVDEYRVYLVMVPKVRIAERAARQGALETRAESAEPTIAQRIATARTEGRTVSAALTADQDLVSTATAAAAATGSINVTALVGLTPSGYPGNAEVIAGDRAGLVSARTDLVALRSDVRTIRTTLAAPAT